MANARASALAAAMAREMAASIGTEIVLARANLGLSRRAAARLAGVAPATYRSVERGDPRVRITTASRVAVAVGLKVWGKAFPVSRPSLRDRGQLRFADHIRVMAHASLRFVMEHHVGKGLSIDVVLFGAVEILAIEIVRQLADFQAQYRAAHAKRTDLAGQHQRRVRLVLVIQDTERNRAIVRQHADLIAAALPAGTREVFASIRTGRPLGRDGIAWTRARDLAVREPR